MIQLCKNCKSNNNASNSQIFSNGYFTKDNCCLWCGNTDLVYIDMAEDDFIAIKNISDDVSFLEAMIDLKEKDIVEYQLKMSQFRNQANQQRVVRENSAPKCPHCHSTQIKSISGLERGASVLTWGLFSKKISKSFKCNNCGYTW